MRILLIRHGRQSDARCNVDVGLAAEGRRQAEAVARRIEHWGVEKMYSSDLIRARQTAEIINARLRLPHEIVGELREIDFGALHGLTDEEIDARFGQFKQDQSRMDLDLHYPGPGGENIADLLERVLPAITAIAQGPENAVAISTHGVVIRALAAFAVGIPLPRWRLVATALENCSITELRSREPDLFTLERLNDHAHLEAYPELLRSAWGVNEN